MAAVTSVTSEWGTMSAMDGLRQVTMTLYRDGETIEAEPVMIRPGQAAEGHVTMDSVTGKIGMVEIDAFEVNET
jgi:hypothetical protein